MAKLTAMAMGRKSLPSMPVSAKSGKNTTMMIRMAKATGLTTSRAASSTAASRASRPARRSDTTRKAFSTITTAPSTIMPIPTARPPSDIRLAESPVRSIKRKAISIESGTADTTTSAERISPRKRNRTTMTRTPPSRSARWAVPTALSTSSV